MVMVKWYVIFLAFCLLSELYDKMLITEMIE